MNDIINTDEVVYEKNLRDLKGYFFPHSASSFFTGLPLLALLFCGAYGAQVVLATLEDDSFHNQRYVMSSAYVLLFV